MIIVIERSSNVRMDDTITGCWLQMLVDTVYDPIALDHYMGTFFKNVC